ncbi:MAG: hypothetical protein WAZ27_00235 [Minisyncoccia bacterium]
MGKRGPKPEGKVKIKWSPNFAYAIGLLVSDGCLSPSGRHIIFTSADRDQLENFMRALDIKVHIGRVENKGDGALRVQFGDVLFYQFLKSIGLMPNKSRIIGKIDIPDEYFFDFLRGSFDGDGCTYSYWDKRWRSSFMFYTTFVSASEAHVNWLQQVIENKLGLHGHITHGGPSGVLHQLKYAKAESRKLLRQMYRRRSCIYLRRKRLKIDKMLRIVGEKL